ncbi:hypothetical protein H2200_003402 [Cladophialophora chaetospira]|uniref:AB hydrolase-1 domain-containing protein n=1 Tax=Cladophialophora chaetospira TaxID=386627 RepID=A0AA39CM89_9EURO|nr:hypothetical protein H2200_003402 [Cladophialophora chaetospira]
MLHFAIFSVATLAIGASASSKVDQLKVPLDWDHTDGEKITLGLTKVPNNSTNNKGALFFNPGGPGVVTSDLLAGQTMGYDVFGDLADNFDIIGIDPRGIGLSQPIICDPDKFNAPWPKFPQSEAAFNDLVNYNKAFWESCSNLTGKLLGHVDTLSVAKDFEAVRKAMDIPKINYLGLSYGTVIGSQYAELYPDKFRAMALDGNVDHSQTLLESFETEVTAYETEMERFISWCESDQSCVLNGENVTQIWMDLVDSAFENPIPAPGCEDPTNGCQPNVWGGDILFNAQDMLMFKKPVLWAKGTTWATLGLAIQQATAGNATLLSSSTATSNSSNVFAEPAVQCLDWITPIETFADLQYIYELASYLAPLTRGASQSYWEMISCIGYPLPVRNPSHTMNITNSANNTILMTNARYDPSTSIVWAEGLREQIAFAGLVVREGDGHTSFGLFGQTTEMIENYLANMTLPVQNCVTQS